MTLHDGSRLVLEKNASDYDLTSRKAAMNRIESVKEAGKILTGVIYHNESEPDTHGLINTCNQPLNALSQADLCPGSEVLNALNAQLR